MTRPVWVVAPAGCVHQGDGYVFMHDSVHDNAVVVDQNSWSVFSMRHIVWDSIPAAKALTRGRAERKLAKHAA